MALPIGTIVKIDKLSPGSITLYNSYAKKHPYLICPCSLNGHSRFIIKSFIGKSAVIAQIMGQNTALTLFLVSDIKKVS